MHSLILTPTLTPGTLQTSENNPDPALTVSGPPVVTVPMASVIMTTGRTDSITIITGTTLVSTQWYDLVIPAGAVKDTNGNPMAGIDENQICFGVEDTTPPYITLYQPTLGEVNVPMDASSVMRLQFNEPVTEQALTSKLIVMEGINQRAVITSDNYLVESNGRTVQVTMPWGVLAQKSTYTVVTSETVGGMVKDQANAPFEGICGSTGLTGKLCLSGQTTTSYTFTTEDTTPPLLVPDPSLSPKIGCDHSNAAVSTLDFDKSSDLVLAFNEPVQLGSSAGEILLIPSVGRGVLQTATNNPHVMSMAGPPSISIPMGALTITPGNSQSITIDPGTALVPSQWYDLLLPAGLVKDSSGNGLVAIPAGQICFGVADTVPPYITKFRPALGSTAVTNGTVSYLTFNEAVTMGTAPTLVLTPVGHIYGSPGALAIAPSSITLVPGSSKVEIQLPWEHLVQRQTYQMTTEMPAGLVTDVAGLPHAGICGSPLSTPTVPGPCLLNGSHSTYNFTVVDDSAPAIVSAEPSPFGCDPATAFVNVSGSGPIAITFDEDLVPGGSLGVIEFAPRAPYLTGASRDPYL